MSVKLPPDFDRIESLIASAKALRAMKMKSKLSEALALINELDNCERVTVLTAIIAVMPHYLTLQDFSGMLTLARWGGMLGSKDGDGIGDFSGLTLSTEGGKWTPDGEDE